MRTCKTWKTCKICGSMASDPLSCGHYCDDCRAELAAGVSLTVLLQTVGKKKDVNENKDNKDKYITK